MAVRFDAAADRLSYSAVAPPAAFTITLWAYLSVDRNAVSAMVRLWDAGSATVGVWATTSDGTGGPQWVGVVSNTTGFVVGEWRKAALTYNGTTAQVLVATPAGVTEVDAGAVSAPTPAGITLAGRQPSSNQDWWNGRLACVRIWSAVLSQSEVEAEWGSFTPVRSSDLFANWRLATATDLTDTVAGRVLTTVAGSALTTEDDPPLTTAHVKTGGAAALGAGSGVSVLSPATAHVELGGAAAGTAGSGSVELAPAAEHAKAGGAAPSGAGSGAQGAPLVVHARAGGAVATVAGSGQDVVAHLSAIRTRLHAGTPVAVGRFYAGVGIVP